MLRWRIDFYDKLSLLNGNFYLKVMAIQYLNSIYAGFSSLRGDLLPGKVCGYKIMVYHLAYSIITSNKKPFVWVKNEIVVDCNFVVAVLAVVLLFLQN